VYALSLYDVGKQRRSKPCPELRHRCVLEKRLLSTSDASCRGLVMSAATSRPVASSCRSLQPSGSGSSWRQQVSGTYMHMVAKQLASRIKRVASCIWRLECMTVHLDKAAGTRPAPFPSTASSHPARAAWMPAVVLGGVDGLRRGPHRVDNTSSAHPGRGGAGRFYRVPASTATSTATSTYVARRTSPAAPSTYICTQMQRRGPMDAPFPVVDVWV
jgi:hypothetical protein